MCRRLFGMCDGELSVSFRARGVGVFGQCRAEVEHASEETEMGMPLSFGIPRFAQPKGVTWCKETRETKVHHLQAPCPNK